MLEVVKNYSDGARLALVMPAGMIYLKEIHSESVVLDVYFIHRGFLLTAFRALRYECKDEEPLSSCYPALSLLALIELMAHLRLVLRLI